MTYPRPPLQPSLRDRLRGSATTGTGELPSRSRRRQLHGEMAQLKASIESSLLTLLMTRQPSSVPDWRRWPHAEASVLNFGVPDLSGICASGLAAGTLRRKLKQIIVRFEPRLHAETLQLEVKVSGSHPESVTLWIHGDVGPRDAPEAFSLGMSICLVTGHADSVQVRNAA